MVKAILKTAEMLELEASKADEQAKTQKYLISIQDELENILSLNNDLRISNRKKDDYIESKRAYLKSFGEVSSIAFEYQELVS